MSKIIGIILIIVGCFFIFKAGNQYYYGKQSLNWQTTIGTITFSNWTRAGGSNSGYKAKIEYDYSVNDVPYSSDFIEFSEFNNANLAYKFKEGKEVKIYFNPTKPQMSVLIPGYSWKSIGLFIGMGIFFFIFALLVLWSTIKKMIKEVYWDRTPHH